MPLRWSWSEKFSEDRVLHVSFSVFRGIVKEDFLLETKVKIFVFLVVCDESAMIKAI